ncbi:MAG: DUF2259 domain-containing protein [Alphaproteobacteria bacterium]
MRRRCGAFALAAGLGAAAAPAVAGDMARAEVIGFSVDGAFVAVEEYGVQDGSGSFYSAIEVLDVAADRPVDGARVAVLLDYEAMTEAERDDGLAMARAQARAAAAPTLAASGIVDGNAGTLVIARPPSDLDAPPHTVRMSLGAAFNPYWMQDREVLQLTERPADAPDCPDYGEPPMLFALTLTLDEGATVALHDDTALPAARGCPTGYRIHSVIAYLPGLPSQAECCRGRTTALLVLVQLTRPGFEGPDWRFVPVTAVVEGMP